MHKNEERRFTDLCEIRVTQDDKAKRVSGYAAVWNKWSQGLPWKERIAKGAFARTLGQADVRALLNHDPNFVLGRNKAGTLELEEDDKGLRVAIQPPATTWAEDLMVSMERGDINQMSFAFQSVKDSWSEDGKTRDISEVKLYDVSIVTYPAYPATTAQVRSILHDFGFDFNATAALLERRRNGSVIKGDEELVESLCAVLRGCSPSGETQTRPADSGDTHSAGEPRKPGGSHLLEARLRAIGLNLKLRKIA